MPKNAQELLLEFRITGRQEPFEEIVRRYAGMVYHVCLQVTKNAHDAEDATQAVFLTLAVQAKTAKEIRSLGPWLQQVAKRLSLDLRKSRKRRQRREERHGMMTQRNGNGNGHGDGTTPLQREELKAVLSEELHNLPTKYRLPLILHYFGGMSRQAMAEELQCKSGTLGARLHRGRAMLGVRLAERGVSLKDGALAGAVALSVYSAVTDTLVCATSEAATHLAAGRELGVGLISANVVGMVRRAVQMALYAKLKAVAVGLLLAGSMVAAGAEVVSRAVPTELRFPSPTDLGGRLWPLLQPLLRPSYGATTTPTDVIPVPTVALYPGVREPVEIGGSWAGTRGTDSDWALGTLNRPESSGPLFSEVNGDVTPHLFPGRSSVGGTAAEATARPTNPGWTNDPEILLPGPARLRVMEVAMPQPAAGPLRTLPMTVGTFRGGVAAVPTPPSQMPPTTPPAKTPEYRPLSPATDGGNAPANVPPRGPEDDVLVKSITPPPSDPPPPPPSKIAPISDGPNPMAFATSDRGRDVMLFPSSKTVTVSSPTTDTKLNGNHSVTYSYNATLDTENASWVITRSLEPASDSFTSYYTNDLRPPIPGASSDSTPFTPGGTTTTPPPSADLASYERVALPGIRLRGVRIGPPDMLRGYGVVEDTNIFDQSGQVIADGLGTPQTLDLSKVRQIVNTMPNPVGVGVNGWFAQDGGKLLLPPIQVAHGAGSYNWGDSQTDPRIDLINSVNLGFENVTTPGSLQIALLSFDRPDVPRLPTGHHFVGLWEFGGANLGYQGVGLTVRYDQTLVATLGLDESYLKLWRYDAGGWQIVTGHSLDRIQKLISGKTERLSYFAISTPEPGGIMLVAAAALLLCQRKRRH